jgi:hypothetical protein
VDLLRGNLEEGVRETPECEGQPGVYCNCPVPMYRDKQAEEERKGVNSRVKWAGRDSGDTERGGPRWNGFAAVDGVDATATARMRIDMGPGRI